jgi:hypothetical protein
VEVTGADLKYQIGYSPPIKLFSRMHIWDLEDSSQGEIILGSKDHINCS